MSVQSISDAQKQAFVLLNTTPDFRHFATTRIRQARPKDTAPYGKVIAVPVDSNDVTLYGFDSKEGRDKFVAENFAAALDLNTHK